MAEAGSGIALIFVHEFAGDWRSWEAQIRFFSRYYRRITYSAHVCGLSMRGAQMKRSIPTSGLVVLPQAGHTINLENPEPFNRAVLDFLTRVETGRWMSRDTRSTASGILRFRK